MRPQVHLASIARHHGTGNASDALRAVLHRGLRTLNEQEQAARIAARGTADKLNPYVSDAGKCPRQVTLSLLNVPGEPFTDDSLMNFLVGHAVEEAWAKILTAAGCEYVREDRVEIPAGTTRVTGRQDFGGIRLVWRAEAAEELGIPEFDDIPDGSIIELKSINSRSMGWMLKRGEQGKEDHRKQLGLYVLAKDAPAGFLVYLVKDATKGEPILHAWLVDRDDAQANNDLQGLALADEMAKAGKVPPIPNGYKSTGFPCSYCQYRGACWGGERIAELLTMSIEQATTREEAVNE